MASQIPIIVTCLNLNQTLQLFTAKLGFRLEMISPADSPTIAILSGHGTILRLEESSELKPISFTDSELEIPAGTNEFILTKFDDENSWGEGRAGMQYRDLIPGRLGGRFIASQIRIERGGEVPDYVHFHKIRFQMIYCLSGWARLVYEDQGEPFLMKRGDCVLQPSQIRHRVLECSNKFEVLEIGCPAIHETFADHQLKLPNDIFSPERIFGEQRFVHHIAENAIWEISELENFQSRETGISDATDGLADVQILRAQANSTFFVKHSGEFLFYFVQAGNLTFSDDKGELYNAGRGDSFVIPRDSQYCFEAAEGLEMIRVRLP